MLVDASRFARRIRCRALKQRRRAKSQSRMQLERQRNACHPLLAGSKTIARPIAWLVRNYRQIPHLSTSLKVRTYSFDNLRKARPGRSARIPVEDRRAPAQQMVAQARASGANFGGDWRTGISRRFPSSSYRITGDRHADSHATVKPSRRTKYPDPDAFSLAN